jgi:hypothetical protein
MIMFPSEVRVLPLALQCRQGAKLPYKTSKETRSEDPYHLFVNLIASLTLEDQTCKALKLT